MKLAFKDMVDIGRLQELTDELYRSTGIPSAIIAVDGEVLTGSGWQRICTEFHRRHPEIMQLCIESDTRLRSPSADGEEFAVYQCPMGLVDASMPVVIDGAHLANVFSGQLLTAPPDAAVEAQFRARAQRFGLDEEQYMAAFREVPVFSIERFQGALSFLARLAHLVADIGLVRKRELEVSDRSRLALLSLAEDQRAAAAALRASEEKYRGLFNSLAEGFALHEILCDEQGTPVDYRFLDANPAFFELTGLPRDIIGRTVREVLPATEDLWIETYGRVAHSGEPTQFEQYTAALGSRFEVRAFSPQRGQFATVFLDISERRRAEIERVRLLREIRRLAARVAAAEDAERKELARELHDRVSQSLTALGLNLSVLRSRLPKQALAELGARLDDAESLLRATAGEVRNVMAELRPPMLDEYGLVAALRWYGEQVASRSGLAITVSGDEPSPRFGPDIEMTLFRIAQEALTNVTKHAAATRVAIATQPTPRGATLTIGDDGAGFDPAAARASAGGKRTWGQLIMQERATSVGAACTITSQRGGGTVVTIEITRPTE